MVRRFVYNTGSLSVTEGASFVTGTGTAWAGKDREGAQVWHIPNDAAPVFIGSVDAVDPRGIYGNTELPLSSPYNGPTLTGVAYELIDGAAIANGVTQAAIYARFAAFLESDKGLVGNTADQPPDWADVPENTLFVDGATRQLYQWRGGLLNTVYSVGLAFTPRGAWDTGETYSQSDLVEHEGHVFVSNIDDNEANEPDDTPASTTEWTWLLLPQGPGDLFDVGAFVPGRPRSGGLVARHDFRGTITFPEDLTGSRSSAGNAATAETVFSLRRNGTPFGTVTFAAASAAGVMAAASETIFTPGDVLEIVAPEPRDATLANVSITLAGNR